MSQSNPPRGAIRLHYRDVVALLEFMNEVIEEDSRNLIFDDLPNKPKKEETPKLVLSGEEFHAYERLKDMKVQMEDFFRWSEGLKKEGKEK